MIGYLPNFYRHIACWALFLLVFDIATPSARGQQVPLFDVPTFGTNETFRSNFCELHRQVDTDEIPLRNALKNLNLRPALFRYQLDKETGGIPEVNTDIAIKILDEIARRAQFEWRDSYAVVDSPDGNQTWGDVLSWSIDTYDLNGDWYLRTTERLADNVLFPEKWYDGSLIMIRKRPELDVSFQIMSFKSPFTNGVWFLLFATTLISGLVYYAIDYIGCDGERNKMEASMRKSVFQTFLNMTGQYVFDPKQPGNRTVALSTCFFFLIILASYTANLISFLVIRNSPGVVINDIQDVIKNDLSVCVLQGATSESYMRERYSSARLVGKESIGDTYLGLDNGSCDVVLTTISTWKTKKLDIIYNEDCRKEWVGRIVQVNDAGFSLRDSSELCASLVRDVFSLHLLEMKRDKTYDTIWDTHRANSVTNNCQDIEDAEEDSDLVKMSLKNIGGIFILHFIALAISLLYTTCSSWQRKRKVKLSGATTTQSRLPTHNSSLKITGSKRTTTTQDASSKSFGATTKIFQGIQEDTELSEARSVSMGATTKTFQDIPEDVAKFDDLSIRVARSHTLQMEKQMECMESMKKQMEVMQAQLAKLLEGKKVAEKKAEEIVAKKPAAAKKTKDAAVDTKTTVAAKKLK